MVSEKSLVKYSHYNICDYSDEDNKTGEAAMAYKLGFYWLQGYMFNPIPCQKFIELCHKNIFF